MGVVAVLGHKFAAVAVALVRKAVVVVVAVAVAVTVGLGRQLAVVPVREPAAVVFDLAHKPATVAMGIVATASIEPAAQRMDSPGHRRDTPRFRTDYRQHGYSPLSAPSAVAAAPMEPSETRVCQK